MAPERGREIEELRQTVALMQSVETALCPTVLRADSGHGPGTAAVPSVSTLATHPRPRRPS